MARSRRRISCSWARWPCFCRTWDTQATSIRVAMFRPGATGMLSWGIRTPRMRWSSGKRRPSRSYSFFGLHFLSRMTRSMGDSQGDRLEPEDLADVDDPQAADLHEEPAEDRGPADDPAAGSRADLHHVVGDEAVAAGDQLEGALALPDAAVADDQDAQAEHPQQPAGDDGRRGGGPGKRRSGVIRVRPTRSCRPCGGRGRPTGLPLRPEHQDFLPAEVEFDDGVVDRHAA